MKVAVQGYHAGKAWLCICVGVEPPFSKSWIRHCVVHEHSKGTTKGLRVYKICRLHGASV